MFFPPGPLWDLLEKMDTLLSLFHTDSTPFSSSPLAFSLFYTQQNPKPFHTQKGNSLDLVFSYPCWSHPPPPNLQSSLDNLNISLCMGKLKIISQTLTPFTETIFQSSNRRNPASQLSLIGQPPRFLTVWLESDTLHRGDLLTMTSRLHAGNSHPLWPFSDTWLCHWMGIDKRALWLNKTLFVYLHSMSDC